MYSKIVLGLKYQVYGCKGFIDISLQAKIQITYEYIIFSFSFFFFSDMADQSDATDEDSYAQGMSFFSTQHSEALRANVESFRVNGNYTDVTILIEDKKFSCHRAILAAGSYYFKSMFSSGMEETHKSSFTIKQIDPLVFGHVLHFIYTGSITITSGIVFELFSQSHMFQISTLVELCVQFFKEKINDANCLCALSLADAHAHTDLYEFTKQYACEHFTSLVNDEDFIRLSGECVVDLLKDRRLNCTAESQVQYWLSFFISTTISLEVLHIN